jgi:hypothetical protein
VIEPSHGQIPNLPLTPASRKAPVPGLALFNEPPAKLDPPTARHTLAVPRKKEEFTVAFIVDFLNDSGVKVEVAEADSEDLEKSYSPDDGEHGDDDHDHGGYGYDEHDD